MRVADSAQASLSCCWYVALSNTNMSAPQLPLISTKQSPLKVNMLDPNVHTLGQTITDYCSVSLNYQQSL